MVARARSPWPFLLSQLRLSDRPGFGRADLDAAGLDPAELLCLGLIEREGDRGAGWRPPGCQNGCLPNLDFETRRAEGLVGVACPEDPPCWQYFEWHPERELERYSCSAGRVFGALREANGLEPLVVPPQAGVVSVGVLARRGKRIAVVWMRSATSAFAPTCLGLRAMLGGDALAVLLSRTNGGMPALMDGGVIPLEVAVDDGGDLRLWRALDLLDPDYRARRVASPDAIFDDVTMEFAEEPGVRHIVRINGREFGGFQKSDLKFLRLLLLAARRWSDADVDRGGWLDKAKLQGPGRDREIEDIRKELEKYDHPALAAEERPALLKRSPTRDGKIRLAVPPASICFDESLADLQLIGERQTEPRSGRARQTPGQQERAEHFALSSQIARRLLDEARRLGVRVAVQLDGTRAKARTG